MEGYGEQSSYRENTKFYAVLRLRAGAKSAYLRPCPSVCFVLFFERAIARVTENDAATLPTARCFHAKRCYEVAHRSLLSLRGPDMYHGTTAERGVVVKPFTTAKQFHTNSKWFAHHNMRVALTRLYAAPSLAIPGCVSAALRCPPPPASLARHTSFRGPCAAASPRPITEATGDHCYCCCCCCFCC